MMPLETILSGFLDSEQIRELRFHVQSLRQDLAASIAKLETCLPLPAMEAAAIWELRETIADATAAIEHDAQHHVQRALDLVSAISDEDDRISVDAEPATTPSLLSSAATVSDDIRDQLVNQLGVTLAALARVQASVVEIATMQSDDPARLPPYVASAAEVLQRVAWPAALHCLALAQALHHVADPAAAAEEARADELATPMRSTALDGARSLNTCPQCGAPLTADDRTFDGSYCESCRTRFFEHVQRTE